MEAFLPDFAFPILAAGLCYFAAAQSIQTGVPPFYRDGVPLFSFNPFGNPHGNLAPGEVERQIKLVAPFFGGMMISLVLFVATQSSIFLPLTGMVGIAGGLRIRHDIRKTVGIPLQWVSSYWTLKWPMLLFDIWTVSFAGLMVLLTAL